MLGGLQDDIQTQKWRTNLLFPDTNNSLTFSNTKRKTDLGTLVVLFNPTFPPVTYICHGRYPKQAKTDEVAMSRKVPKDKAYVGVRQLMAVGDVYLGFN